MPAAIKGTITIDGEEIIITNPEKLLWPECGITKRIYLQKLAALSPYLLRYCRDRLLTVIRYPHGISGMSFYQKMHLIRSRPLSKPLCTRILTISSCKVYLS